MMSLVVYSLKNLQFSDNSDKGHCGEWRKALWPGPMDQCEAGGQIPHPLCHLPPLPKKVLSIHMEVGHKRRWSDLRNLFWDFGTPQTKSRIFLFLHYLTIKYIFRRSLNLLLSPFPALWCTACICHTAGGHHGYPRMQQLQVHKFSGKNQSKLLILCQVDVSFSNLHG